MGWTTDDVLRPKQAGGAEAVIEFGRLALFYFLCLQWAGELLSAGWRSHVAGAVMLVVPRCLWHRIFDGGENPEQLLRQVVAGFLVEERPPSYVRCAIHIQRRKT